MASFPPFKAYMLSLLDELIERHGLSAPFLDLGCGAGDVARHLALRGWEGTAVDSSPGARALASDTLRPFPGVRVRADSDGRTFATVVMLDVLEHVPDDVGLLARAAAQQPSGGFLLIVVPTNHEREWRWDDDLYGHLRRYQPEALRTLVESAGYQVVEMWDVTFPIFWLMRRGFTRLKRPPPITRDASALTAASATAEAWSLGPFSDLLKNVTMWRPVFALQRRFRHRLESGHEMMLLARRTASQ